MIEHEPSLSTALADIAKTFNAARVLLLASFVLGAAASGQGEIAYRKIWEAAQPIIQPLIDKTSLEFDQEQGHAS